jgi:S1-C subfamily serine protease
MKSTVCLLVVALMMLVGSPASLYAQAEEAVNASISIQIGEDGQPIVEAEGIDIGDVHVAVVGSANAPGPVVEGVQTQQFSIKIEGFDENGEPIITTEGCEEGDGCDLMIQIGEDGQPIVTGEGINPEDVHVEIIEGGEIISGQAIEIGDNGIAIRLGELLQEQGVIAEAIGEAVEIIGEVVEETPGVAIAIGGGEGIDIQVGSEGELETVTSYWIGVLCTPLSEAVRAQVNVPEETGVIIEQVVPGSPAAEAGLLRHDIIVAAGDAVIRTQADLVDAVTASEGEALLLKVLRGGETVEVEATPAAREVATLQRRGPFVFQLGPDGPEAAELEEAIRIQIEELQEHAGEGLPFRFHMMRPGVIVEQGVAEGEVNAQAIAEGVTATTVMSTEIDGAKITITRSGDTPAGIKIEQDGEVIETTEDNLDVVPDELKPRVKQMLRNARVQINATGPDGVNIGVVPHFQGRINAVPLQPSIQVRPAPRLIQPPIEARPIPQRVQPSMSQQLEQMQRQLEELRRQIEKLEQE